MTALPEEAFRQFQYPTVPLHVMPRNQRDAADMFASLIEGAGA